MNYIFKEFEDKDVLNYWLSLFPNLSTHEQVREHIEEILNIPIEQCGEQSLFYSYLTSCDNKNFKIKISNDQKDKIRQYMEMDNKDIPIYKVYEDIVYDNIGSLLSVIDKSLIIEDKDYFIENTILQLNSILDLQYIRTIVLELNCAREDNILKGENTYERYDYFINNLLSNKNYKEEFFNEYSSLLVITEEIIQNFCEYVKEILINTELEIEKLNKLFFENSELKKIKRIKLSEGDTHCNGKSVAIIYFSTTKIVYKPRNMKIDLQFQKFIEWINSKKLINGIRLKTLKIHTLNNCGWMEYVEQESCSKEEEVKNFYIKSGVLLGILYCFNSVDFHFENIIACGEDPVLVDLETLFHPVIKSKFSMNENSAFHIARDFIEKSVSQIGLLPTKMKITKNNRVETIDVGALSESKEQNNILKSLVLENLNTDRLCLVYKKLPVNSKKNGPKIMGKILNPKNYIDYLIAGFTAFYKFAQINNKEVLKYTLENFSDCQIRIILKSTVTYTNLLSIASHPDFMREPVHRVILLSKIGANEYYNLPIKKFELSELCKGQVPYFYTNFESKDIKAYPNVCFKNNIKESIQNVITQKIKNLSEFDMINQINFIKASFFKRDGNYDITGIDFKSASENPINPNKWIELSEEIAEHILSRSFQGIDDNNNRDRAYIGAQTLMTDTDDWNIDIDGLDLYDGNSGVALFFINLWKLTGNERYYNYAIETIQPIVTIVAKRKSENYKSTIGAYKGVGGLIYVMNKIAILKKDSTLIDTIIGLYEIIEDNISLDVNYDLIGGGIGCLAALLAIYNNPCNEVIKNRALEISIKIYEYLKDKFILNEYGKVINLNRERVCSGFAHGTAGFAPYLFKLYKITYNKEILELVQDILKYERNTFFDKSIPGWHSSIIKEEMDVEWCNGVGGILLSKLLLKEYGYMDDFIDEEINLAFNLVIRNSLGHNLCYCHGDLSILDIIRYYSKIMNNVQIEKQCINIFQNLYESIYDTWNSSNKTLNKYNGLMLGLAGLGYSMLKQYDYENVDEFLWLA